MASIGAATSGSITRPVVPGDQSFRMMLRSWRAELAPFPNRWRRATRVAFVTALGAGVTAILQISNPLGLTMLLSFAAPEYAFSLATSITFLVGAAAMQLLMLAVVGALVNAPVPHVCVFIAYTFITTYLIYEVPRLGRLWVWVQIPTVTAFYLVLFDHRVLGWENAQMFAGLAVAVTMLWLFNNLIWPEPAAAEKAEVPYRPLMQTRHTYATLMLQKGAPIDWLQKQMGHRNLTMLIRHYWRWINPGELSQETLARLGAAKTSSNQPHPNRANDSVSREAWPRCPTPKSAGTPPIHIPLRFGGICAPEGFRGAIVRYQPTSASAAACRSFTGTVS